MAGGWGGIRTHETLSRLPVFKTGTFNHSVTHPQFIFQWVSISRFDEKQHFATHLPPKTSKTLPLCSENVPEGRINTQSRVFLQARNGMRINIERDSDAGMPGTLAGDLRMDTRPKQFREVGVP